MFEPWLQNFLKRHDLQLFKIYLSIVLTRLFKAHSKMRFLCYRFELPKVKTICYKGRVFKPSGTHALLLFSDLSTITFSELDVAILQKLLTIC